MPKIERKTQKIFGGNAESDQLAVFGSMISGTPVYNDDIEALQSEAYTEGWKAAVAANEAPFMEEMNAVQYGFSKQLAYLFQQGIAEWDAGTTYYLNSFCQVGGVIYKSKLDENINHSPGDDTEEIYWTPFKAGDGGGGTALPLLSIRHALYVDESLGLDYYLNGQLLTINSNLQGAVNELKKLKAIRPSLFCTEEEWQATKTLSPNGIVNAFVLDEDAGTLRLPKYPDYIYGGSENAEISVSGNGYGLGLTPDGSKLFMLSKYGGDGNDTNSRPSGPHGAPVPVGQSAGAMGGGYTNIAWGVHPDPAKSGLKGQLTDNTEKITLKYVIRLATGQETEVNITNEIELNNPFFFGMSQYFDVEPNNLSWLKSDGVYKPKSVYPDYYNWILENVNKGVEGFKGQEGYCFIATDSSGYYWWVSTESPVVGASVYRYDAGVNSMFFDGTVETLTSNGFTFTAIFEGSSYTVTRDSSKDTSILHPTAWITDNDFEINTSDETFRLPLKNGTEGMFGGGAVVGNGMSLGLTNGSQTAGLTSLTFHAGVTDRGTLIGVKTGYGLNIGQSVSGSAGFDGIVTAGITTDPEKSGLVVANAGVVPDGWALYYYVGATVQNANLIDAGRMQEQITNINAPSRGYLVQSYVNGTSGYRVYSDGWCEQWGKSNSTSGQETITLTKAYNSINFTVLATSYGNNLYGTAQIINNKTIWIESRGHDFTVQPCLVRWLTMGYIS